MKSQSALSELQSIFVELLARRNIKYLVIGGKAVQANGVETRQTKDLDILLGPTQENITAFGAALSKFRQPPQEIKSWEAWLSVPNRLLQYPGPHDKELDILTSIDGIDFAECWGRSIAVEFGKQKMQVASRSDTIAMKHIAIATGNDPAAKAQDLADIEALQSLG